MKKQYEPSKAVHLWSRIVGTAVALSTTLWWGGTARGDVNIDNFDLTFQAATIFGPPTPFASDVSVALAPEGIGRQRDIYITRTSRNGGEVKAYVDPSIGSGLLAYASGPGTTGSALIEWDGIDSGGIPFNARGLGGVDFTQGGRNTGVLIRATSDLGATLWLTVHTDATNFSTIALTLPPDPSFTLVSYSISFALFMRAGGRGADFNNVGAVALYIDGSTPAVDVFVDSIDMITAICR